MSVSGGLLWADGVLRHEQEGSSCIKNHMSKGPDCFPYFAGIEDFLGLKSYFSSSLERRYAQPDHPTKALWVQVQRTKTKWCEVSL